MSYCSARVVPLVLLILAGSASAMPAEETPVAHRDIVFASIEGTDLKLNLFLPDNATRPPLVIYIHGGGWRNGSYRKNLVPWMTDHGFALASVSYRLTDKATFPAQIHDVKASVRWLRAHAETYGYDATRIGVCGTSAGGHLAMLLGMSGDVEALEGSVGEHAGQSSRVQAVVNYYGPSDFVLRSKTQPAKTESPDGSAYLLLNGRASEQPDKARLASPAWQVSRDDPPLLILHGEKDATVLPDQAERIREAYESAGLSVACHFEKNAGHGGAVFFQGPNRTRVLEFFSKHLSP